MEAAGTHRDVTVVGASVTGLFTAARLARNGMNVSVLERASGLPSSSRTLIVTNRFLDQVGHLAKKAVVHEINGFEMFADGKVGSVSLEKPDLIIERSQLLGELTKDAIRSGVRVRYGRRFVALRKDDRRLRFDVEGQNGGVATETTQVLVGADGALSRVARAAGWAPHATVSLLQAEVLLPKSYAPDVTSIWFLPEETPYFFWLIPHSDSHGVVGLISDGKQRATASLSKFLETRGLCPISYQAAVIPEYRRWVPIRKRIQDGEVFLVGDAAGHVKVSTVGGIVTGFRGAEAAIAAISGRGVRRDLRRLRTELNLHLAIRKALHRFSEDDYRFVLDHLDDAARVPLGAIDRDQAARILRQVFRHRPQLIIRGLRALVTSGSAKGQLESFQPSQVG